MLSLTLTSGERVKIGEDVQIVFDSTPSTGRIKISVEAPREKRIERVAPVKKKTDPKIVIVKKVGSDKNVPEK